eukprot:TRINITY_DN90391_c0_g1_i1.p1 TRINITY_DN90391_c0_g1~~TRINITY_DN90391_c0_g1_i1.p1  ORF type:complete len:478 (-),score=115.84 TRINITY_DN90391_c0_g1_i1:145-1578(-)
MSGVPVPPGLEVRPAPGKGLGVFATAPFAAGVQVFTDQPLFLMQHTGNRRVVAGCAHCCAFVGGPTQLLHAQLEALFSEPRFQPLVQELAAAGVVPHWQALYAGLPAGEPVRCSQGCGEIYCSAACREAHFTHSHNLLCTGPITSEEHPLLKFKYHAIEHAETLLMAAQAFAFVVNRAKANGGGVEATRAVMADLMNFHHAPFRDACRPPPGRGKDAEFMAHTDSVLNQAAMLLKAALDLQAPVEASALFESGAAFLSEVLGFFELNNFDVEVASPIGAPLLARGRALMAEAAGNPQAAAELGLLEKLLREKEWLMRCIWGEETTGNYGDDVEADDSAMADDAGMGEAELEKKSAEVASDFMAKARQEVGLMTMEQLLEAPWPTMHGAALYPLVCRMNHSCMPNVKVDHNSNSALATVVSLSGGAVGEELSVSYIGTQEKDVQLRRRRLAEYGFMCNCARCLQEDSGSVRKTQKRLK